MTRKPILKPKKCHFWPRFPTSKTLTSRFCDSLRIKTHTPRRVQSEYSSPTPGSFLEYDSGPCTVFQEAWVSNRRKHQRHSQYKAPIFVNHWQFYWKKTSWICKILPRLSESFDYKLKHVLLFYICNIGELIWIKTLGYWII